MLSRSGWVHASVISSQPLGTLYIELHEPGQCSPQCGPEADGHTVPHGHIAEKTEFNLHPLAQFTRFKDPVNRYIHSYRGQSCDKTRVQNMLCTSTWICISTCICTYIYIHTDVCVCVYLFIYLYTYIHTRTYRCTHARMYVPYTNAQTKLYRLPRPCKLTRCETISIASYRMMYCSTRCHMMLWPLNRLLHCDIARMFVQGWEAVARCGSFPCT